MNCYCCGKPLKIDNGAHWHGSCIKRFFGTDELPELDLTNTTLETLALESTNKGFTVPGVQKKLSLHLLSEGNKPKLTLVNYPTGYILKPQVEYYEALPEAEQLVMNMADATGITTVPHALVQLDGPAYITKRVDRIINGTEVRLLAMEDFCQLDRRLTQDKYKGSYERCAKIIERHSSQKMLDMSELFLRLVFCFAVGNSDMHLKNFSLIEKPDSEGEYVLSPAYDMLPVNTVMPEDDEEFALTINGKKHNIRKNDFLAFADRCGMNRTAAKKMIEKVVSMKDKYIDLCRDSLIPDTMKDSLCELIERRCNALK